MRRRMLDAGQTRDGSEATEFRRRIEERKFIRRFDQLCRQLLQAAKIVSEGNGQLKTAFLDTFGNDDSVLAALEKTLREMREGKQD